MRMTVVALAAAISSALILLTACSEQSNPPPPSAPSHGAPHVDHPLSVRYPQGPCSVLTEQQRGQLNVAAPGKPQQDDGGDTGCLWDDANGPSKADITVTFQDPRSFEGLSFIYAAKNDYSYFMPYASIDGYPGVATADQIPGQCDVYVGISDERVVDTRVELGRGQDKPTDYTDPCGRALAMSHDVVETLKSYQ